MDRVDLFRESWNYFCVTVRVYSQSPKENQGHCFVWHETESNFQSRIEKSFSGSFTHSPFDSFFVSPEEVNCNEIFRTLKWILRYIRVHLVSPLSYDE